MTERIIFTPVKGKPREGVLAPGFVTEDKVKVLLDGDPFPVDVPRDQIRDPNGQNDSDRVQSRKVPKSGTGKKNKNRKKDKHMTTDTKPSGKELRKQAQSLGVDGWEDMGRKELAKAIKKASKSEAAPKTTTSESSEKNVPAKKAPAKKTTKAAKPAAKKTAPKKAAAPAKKTTAKKSPAKKAAAAKKSTPVKKAPKKAAPRKAPKKKGKTKTTTGLLGPKPDSFGVTIAEGKPPKPLPARGENPFRPNSNLHIVAALLLKGGVRRKLAETLSKKTTVNPYVKDSKKVNLDDYDKRLTLGAQTMRDQFGYAAQRIGRGIDGKILVFRPGDDNDPRKGKKAPAPKKSTSKPKPAPKKSTSKPKSTPKKAAPKKSASKAKKR